MLHDEPEDPRPPARRRAPSRVNGQRPHAEGAGEHVAAAGDPGDGLGLNGMDGEQERGQRGRTTAETEPRQKGQQTERSQDVPEQALQVKPERVRSPEGVVDGEGDVWIIDWPQYTSKDHPNAEELLERDVRNVVYYFQRKYGLEHDLKQALKHVRG